MDITYYRTELGYIAVTDESPKGFKDVLFIGRGGPLDDIEETAFEVHQLRKLKPVDRCDVPEVWLEALGYDHFEREPDEPDDILLDPEGENLVAFIPVLRPRRPPEYLSPPPRPKNRLWFDIGLLLGMVIALILIFS